jgi:hypothetical protein
LRIAVFDDAVPFGAFHTSVSGLSGTLFSMKLRHSESNSFSSAGGAAARGALTCALRFTRRTGFFFFDLRAAGRAFFFAAMVLLQ